MVISTSGAPDTMTNVVSVAPLWLPVAVTVAWPSAMAATSPLLSTVAMVSSELDQVKESSVSVDDATSVAVFSGRRTT